MPGYCEFLEAIYDPKNEEHEAMFKWCGGSSDPVTFGLDEVNKLLSEAKLLLSMRPRHTAHVKGSSVV